MMGIDWGNPKGGWALKTFKKNHDRTYLNILEPSRTFCNFIEQVSDVIGTYWGKPKGGGGLNHLKKKKAWENCLE